MHRHRKIEVACIFCFALHNLIKKFFAGFKTKKGPEIQVRQTTIKFNCHLALFVNPWKKQSFPCKPHALVVECMYFILRSTMLMTAAAAAASMQNPFSCWHKHLSIAQLKRMHGMKNDWRRVLHNCASLETS